MSIAAKAQKPFESRELAKVSMRNGTVLNQTWQELFANTGPKKAFKGLLDHPTCHRRIRGMCKRTLCRRCLA